MAIAIAIVVAQCGVAAAAAAAACNQRPHSHFTIFGFLFYIFGLKYKIQLTELPWFGTNHTLQGNTTKRYPMRLIFFASTFCCKVLNIVKFDSGTVVKSCRLKNAVLNL